MRRRLLVIVIALSCLIAISGYLYAFQFHFKPAPTARIVYWNGLFMQIFWVAVVVAILVWGLLLYALWRFRARPGGPPEGPHIHGNTRMEIAWTIAPAAVMGWLLVVSFHGLFEIDTPPPSPDFNVKITAEQFAWTFTYPDGTTGTGPAEPLYLEQNRLVTFDITSKDVIHAFSVPELGIMKDAIPGRINHDSVKATLAGTYAIKCRELCGVGHSYMLGKIIIFPEGNQSTPYGPPPKPAPSGAAPSTSAAPTATATRPADAVVVPVTIAPGGRFSFDPQTITVAKGKPIVFELQNEGDQNHNFYVGTRTEGAVDDGAIAKSETLTGGGTAELQFTFSEDKTWEFWCDVPGHYQGGMKGTLVAGSGSGALNIKKPLLPGFEFVGVAFALAAALIVVARRK